MSCYPLQVVSRMVMNRSGEVFYIGIDSCVPDMDIESRTSLIPLIREAYDDAVLGEKIKEKLSFVNSYSKYL